MADTGKQSPLGVNVLGSILQDKGLTINKLAASYMGASKSNPGYSFGSLVQNTVLRLQTWGIHDAYNRGRSNPDSGTSTLVSNGVFDNLIYVGYRNSNPTDPVIPALGNAKPPTYIPQDPTNRWTTASSNPPLNAAPASTGWPFNSTFIGQEQGASWFPYNTSNVNRSITMWGYIRLHALQAWNEFNYNGSPTARANPEYKEFCSSFLSANAFVNYSNQAILAMKDSLQFLKGTFSNMDDLISADICGVNLSTFPFGNDLIALGKALNLKTINRFGYPSNLLRTLGENNAITQDLSLALLGAGLSNSDIQKIASGAPITVTKEQEQQIYGAFLLIRGVNLTQVLAPLLCYNYNQYESLADLLSVRKLFASSYRSMTVPIYNTQPNPTNSKTYYLIFSNTGINSAITNPAISEIVGYQIPPGEPPITTTTVSPSNYTLPPKGFGAHLFGIIPEEDAVAAGAFIYSMQQIRNINQADIEKFAQVVKSLETANRPGLPLAAGTDVPTREDLATYGLINCGLGTGYSGSFTLSDMFGCMSGLPYPWALIYNALNELGRNSSTGGVKLHNIYQQNFLAITWEKAQLQMTQPYYYTVARAYVPPTTSSNPANPTYQPNPALPNYDPYPYLNGSTGAKTYSSSYYSNGGLPALYDWWYTLNIRLTEDGGGYGRGTAPNPTVTISPNNVGARVQTNVGRNDEAAASLGGGTFGRVNVSINNGGAYRWYVNDVQTNWVDKNGQDTLGNPDTPPVLPPRPFSWIQANIPKETITIQHAPTATLPVQANGAVATGGANTSGDVWADPTLFPGTGGGLQSLGTNPWPSPENANIQQYIDQANAEIIAISQRNTTGTVNLNTMWNVCGTQLKIEQRGRYFALPPVPYPKDNWINLYPTSLYVFVDSIPALSQDTRPHMSAQTLEAISDFDTAGGQSAVVMQRQERNQARLQEVGIPLDNNLNSQLTQQQTQILTMNGVIPGAIDGVPNPTQNYTLPAWPGTIDGGGELIYPSPKGRYVDNTPQITDEFKPGEFGPIIYDIPFPVVGPIVGTGPGDGDDGGGGGDRGGGGGGGGTGGGGGGGTGGGGGGTGGGGGDTGGGGGIGGGGTGGGTGPGGVVIVNPPGPNTPNGRPVIPPNLNPVFTGSTLLPGSPTVQQAIEQVIECNCDCWIT